MFPVGVATLVSIPKGASNRLSAKAFPQSFPIMNEKHNALLLLLLRCCSRCVCLTAAGAGAAAALPLPLPLLAFAFALRSSQFSHGRSLRCQTGKRTYTRRATALSHIYRCLTLSLCLSLTHFHSPARRIAAAALLLLLLLLLASLRTRSFLFDFTPFWFRCVARDLNFSTIKVQKSTVFCMQQLLMAAISS